jgi:hypothetical protein
MNQEQVLDFADYRLWCLADADVAPAVAAMERHEVDGIFVSHIRGFGGQDVDCLAEVKDLKILAIGDAANVDISAVSQLENLEFLAIDKASGTVQLERLARLRHLRLIVAEGRELPAAGLRELRQLAVWNYGGTDLAILEAYPALEHLEMTQARRLTTLDGIEKRTGLVDLDIAYCAKLQDIGALGSLGKLEELRLENVKNIDDYSAIAKLASLKRIVIEKAAPMPNVAFLAGLTQLESVVLRKVTIEDNDLSPLTRLPALSHVFLDKKKEYGSVLKELESAAAARK